MEAQRAPFFEPVPAGVPVGPDVPMVAQVPVVAPPVDMDPPLEQPAPARQVSPEVKFRQNLWSFYFGPEMIALHYDGHDIDVPEFEYTIRINAGDPLDIAPGRDSVTFKYRGASMFVGGSHEESYNVTFDTGIAKSSISFSSQEDNDLANLVDIILNHYGVGEAEQEEPPAMPEEPMAPVPVAVPAPAPVMVQDPIVAPGGRRKTYRKRGKKSKKTRKH